MLSFTLVEESLEAVGKVISRLTFAHAAANLGAVETIVGPAATISHVECSKEERQAMGIPESLIRYSTGLENIQDLKEDVDQAFSILDEPHSYPEFTSHNELRDIPVTLHETYGIILLRYQRSNY